MTYLIFDFDGVIADTWEAAVHANVKTGRGSSEADAVEKMRTYFSKKPHHARGHAMTEDEIATEYRWITEYGAILHEHGFSLFDEFVSEIEKIDTEHKAVVSSGSQNYVIPALTKTNINPTHILAYENHHSKEEKIELVCHDWGVNTADVFYFTDTLSDVYELRDMIAKEKLIGVSWGYCTKKQLAALLDEECILDTPQDIRNVL